MAEDKIRHRIEVIKNPGETFSWKYVMVYQTLKELENDVVDMFRSMGLKGLIEIGGKVYKLKE